MSKILFISAHAPTYKYPQAGQKIAFNNLQEYIDLGNEIDVVIIANEVEISSATDLIDLLNKFNSKNNKNHSIYFYPLNIVRKLISCLNYLNIPLKFATRSQNQIYHKIRELITIITYDIIHFEYSHAAVYLPLVSSLIKSELTKIVISIHDIETQAFLRKTVNNPILGIELARIFNYENQVYSSANNLWVLSEKDKNILTALFSIHPEKILVKPPKLSNFIYQVCRKPENIEKKTLLFWAAMNRSENETAILQFIANCFQDLLAKDSEFKLYIVGANPSAKVQQLANQNIIVTGFVENPSNFFERAEMGIVPLQTGAGIKLKTLEMLAADLPVLSTSIGAEGVDREGKNLIVSDNFQEWVNLIINH
ncbi:glycosyltransferase [Calothrix sp. UHCC 0171]|uniref:glycosyltransferase n=1 Tax=Calothrix sp. UHCC 0171 TaxID=3110245 RepID=UPI002B21DDC5|nr:glycosyltransferase [Calothrix sp. UHCC 0171]MEA5573381.1 glycosyltransferase [Calothrix sp. UHCC 0171]